MRRAVLIAPETFELRESPRETLSPGYARVRVRRAGVCGTDLAIYSGGYAVPLPLVLGHEWSGDVIEVARAQDEPWLGRRVVGEINNHCAATLRAPCALCVAHLPSHCLERTVTGIVRYDGAFQDELCVPVAVLQALPQPLSWDAGALIEPLAAALQTFALSPCGPGDLVVVLGAGRLGALIAHVARSRGASTLAVTRTPRRHPRLARLGVEARIHDMEAREPPPDPLAPATSTLLDEVLERTQGRGADLVVEATGRPEGLATALDLVRPRGTICVKSTPGQPAPSLNMTRLVVNEVRLQGSRCGSFEDAIAYQITHPLPVDALIDARGTIEALEAAMDAAQHGKVMLNF